MAPTTMVSRSVRTDRSGSPNLGTSNEWPSTQMPLDTRAVTYRDDSNSSSDMVASVESSTSSREMDASSLAQRLRRRRSRRANPILDSDSRATRITEILLREQSRPFLELAEAASSQQIERLTLLLQRGSGSLHAFAALVSEDLLSVDAGVFGLTPLGERMIRELVQL
jgi:hypothetical protein